MSAALPPRFQQAMERAEIIITSGGLGPTVDDPTREGVAQAFGVEVEFRPELWEQIQARFRRFNRVPTENNQRQAYIPRGAIAIENPVGTAPAFVFERGDRTVIALPGVPREMEHLIHSAVIPYLRQRYLLKGIIKARVIHTAGAGESQIDDLIGDLELLNNPTVGLAAHTGQVDVRITAKADSESEADALIRPVEQDIRTRLAEWVYGADNETLEEAAVQALAGRGWTMCVVEAGLEGNLIRRLAALEGPFLGGELLTGNPTPDELRTLVQACQAARQADIGLGVTIYPAGERQEVYILLLTPDCEEVLQRPYGGPPGNAGRWALHHSLDTIRRLCLAPSNTS